MSGATTQAGRLRIGVLVDNYNYARFLDACLGSVAAQTRPADQVVVVDDGSTDDSVARLQAIAAAGMPALHVVAKSNGGQLSALVAGAAVLDCDIVCLLDSDDEFEAGHLAAVERAFVADPETDVVYCGHVMAFADGRRRSVALRPGPLPSQRLVTVYLHRYCGGPTSTIALRRDALVRLLADADLPSWRISADAVLVLRAAARGLVRRNVVDETVVYRIHGQNLFQGHRPDRAKLARLHAAQTALVAPEREALDAVDDASRVALYRRELDAAAREPVAAYRYALLAAGALPVSLRARPALWLAYARWLLVGGRG
jgi:glycosyltransferase involved in cell wall biosynthesis